jgi:hypothetical protein
MVYIMKNNKEYIEPVKILINQHIWGVMSVSMPISYNVYSPVSNNIKNIIHDYVRTLGIFIEDNYYQRINNL